MKFYLAGRYARRAELRGYAEELQALGHTVTSRWLWEDDEGIEDDGVRITGELIALQQAGMRDVEDISHSDEFIRFAEPAGSFSRGGRHWETGLAYGCGKPTTVIGERETLFDSLPMTDQFATWRQFVDCLIANG